MSDGITPAASNDLLFILCGIPYNTDYAEKSKMLKYAFLAT